MCFSLKCAEDFGPEAKGLLRVTGSCKCGVMLMQKFCEIAQGTKTAVDQKRLMWERPGMTMIASTDALRARAARMRFFMSKVLSDWTG